MVGPYIPIRITQRSKFSLKRLWKRFTQRCTLAFMATGMLCSMDGRQTLTLAAGVALATLRLERALLAVMALPVQLERTKDAPITPMTKARRDEIEITRTSL